MAGFGDNIQEFMLRVRAEGHGDVDKLRQAVEELTNKMQGNFGAMAMGTKGVVDSMKENRKYAGEIKLLEKNIEGLEAASRSAAQAEKDRLSASISARNLAMDIRERMYDPIARKAFQDSMKGMEQGAETTKKFSYGLLHVAHAIQDMQYGFGAVLNNIPLVAQALGFGPGVAGAAMIAGVAIETLRPHLRELGIALGIVEDVSRRGASSVEALKEKVQAITARPWKLDVDYKDLRDANEQLDLATKRLEAAKAAQKPSSTQEASGKIVREALAEFAGGTDQKTGEENLINIIRAGEMQAGTFGRGHPDFLRIAQEEALAVAEQAKIGKFRSTPAGIAIGATLGFGAATAAGALADSRAEINAKNMRAKAAELRDKVERESLEKIRREETGAASRGEVGGINRLRARFDQFRGLFERGVPGVATPVHPGLFGALGHALPGNVREQERLRNDQEVILELRKAQQEAKDEADRKATEDLNVQGRVGEQAIDRAARLRKNRVVGFEEKKPEPFVRNKSAWERNEEAAGRNRQAFQAPDRAFRDQEMIQDREAMGFIHANRPDLTEGQIRQVVPLFRELSQMQHPIVAMQMAIAQMGMDLAMGQQRLNNELNAVRRGLHAVQGQTRKLQQNRSNLNGGVFPFQGR